VPQGPTMKRDTVINVLLIIAGIVLAFALFGAGVLWKSGATRSPKPFSSAHSVLRKCHHLRKLPDSRQSGH